MAGRVLWIRVCPFFCPSVLEIGSSVFSENQHVGPCGVVLRWPDFLINTFLPSKCGEWARHGPGIGFFLNLLENLAITFF